MSKKDFIAIAKVLIDSRPQPYAGHDFYSQWEFMVNDFADMLSKHKKFNRQLFLDYIDGKCGPNGGKVQA